MIETNLAIAIPFLLLGLAHSLLGEKLLMRPLLAADWSVPRLSRRVAGIILHFAWHLTTVTWFGLALVFLGVDLLVAVAAIGGVSAVIIFVRLRSHLAWPLMLLISLAALRDYGTIGDSAMRIAGWVAVGLLVGAALVHGYWALGGQRWGHLVIPTTPGSGAAFSPPAIATAAVGVSLAGFAALIVMALIDAQLLVSARTVVLWVGVGVLALRAAGDGRLVGFSKMVRGTDFAVADDAYFTPLVVFLAFGAASAAVL